MRSMRPFRGNSFPLKWAFLFCTNQHVGSNDSEIQPHSGQEVKMAKPNKPISDADATSESVASGVPVTPVVVEPAASVAPNVLGELANALEGLIVYAQKRGASNAAEIVQAQTALEHARVSGAVR
jgi:hypothetical protein